MKYKAKNFESDLRKILEGFSGDIEKAFVSNFKFNGSRVSYLTSLGKWENLPKGWTKESVKKFWESLTGDVKHKITKCMTKMKGKVSDPAAFCNSVSMEIK